MHGVVDSLELSTVLGPSNQVKLPLEPLHVIVY